MEEDVKYIKNKNEFIIYDTDLEAAKITELYHNIKKKYYKNITTFDTAQPLNIKEFVDISIAPKKTDKFSIVKYSKNLTYLLTYQKLLNMNATIVDKTKTISEEQYYEIIKKIDYVNCDKSQYRDVQKMRYTFKLTEAKKLNEFTG